MKRENVGVYGWWSMLQIQYQLPIMDILKMEYKECGSMLAVAKKLGVSRQSIYYAMNQRGIKTLK